MLGDSAVVRLMGQEPPKRRRIHDTAVKYVNPGDLVTSETDVLRGHGTYMQADSRNLLACNAGVVERINKLVRVRALDSRYAGMVGDVVVGRISEVLPRRWKVDINATVSGALLLSAVNLPDGIQRRRTHTDELNMRSFFAENDVISAEVFEVKADGAVMLHARSLKYGKLGRGQLVTVPAVLVKPMKNHFHVLPSGVELILGCNGLVWIAPGAPPQDAAHSEAQAAAASAANSAVSLPIRESVARVRNSLIVLTAAGIPIYVATIMDVYNASLELGLAPARMLRAREGASITLSARARTEPEEARER